MHEVLQLLHLLFSVNPLGLVICRLARKILVHTNLFIQGPTLPSNYRKHVPIGFGSSSDPRSCWHRIGTASDTHLYTLLSNNFSLAGISWSLSPNFAFQEYLGTFLARIVMEQAVSSNFAPAFPTYTTTMI